MTITGLLIQMYLPPNDQYWLRQEHPHQDWHLEMSDADRFKAREWVKENTVVVVVGEKIEHSYYVPHFKVSSIDKQ